MSSIGSNVALLLAGMDLEVVRLIRNAIAVADTSTAGAATRTVDGVPFPPATSAIPGGTATGAANGAESAVDAPPTYRAVDDRQRSGPLNNASRRADSFERHRPESHLNSATYRCDRARPVSGPTQPPAIQPPWKTLPWPVTPPPVKYVRRIIKICPGRTDVKDVGAMLDVFL